jgi:hypothetical protein
MAKNGRTTSCTAPEGHPIQKMGRKWNSDDTSSVSTQYAEIAATDANAERQTASEREVRFSEFTNRGSCSDSERFISTCNDLQEHGRHHKSL